MVEVEVVALMVVVDVEVVALVGVEGVELVDVEGVAMVDVEAEEEKEVADELAEIIQILEGRAAALGPTRGRFVGFLPTGLLLGGRLNVEAPSGRTVGLTPAVEVPAGNLAVVDPSGTPAGLLVAGTPAGVAHGDTSLIPTTILWGDTP